MEQSLFFKGPDVKLLKNIIRQRLKQQRLSLDSSFQSQASEKIAKRIFQHRHFIQASHIAFYSATQGEISTQLILERALALKKCCYFPVLSQQTLQFIKVDKETTLTLNQYGILEPQYSAAQLIAPQKLDLVLLPLVAFDNRGHRLGMGKGYYDKTFAFRKRTLKPNLMGLAYDFQRTTMIPSSNLDVLLDEIVTEKKCYLPPKTGVDHPKTTDP